MHRWISLFESLHNKKELLLLCKYLKNYFKMDFIVLGGAAFAIYTESSSHDLDIVVYDYGKLNESEVDRVIAKDNKGNLVKIQQFGVKIDLLKPGQSYKQNDYEIFSIPRKFNNVNEINGIKVISKEDLIKYSKDKDREKRRQELNIM